MLSNEIIAIISKEFNIPKETIEHIYKAYWKEARARIVSIDFFNLLENKKDMRANVKVPGLGTLQVNEKVLKHLNERYKNKED